ncbi:hypothetical protein U1Q18_022575 [Sarracenia purpurea var. burkii]
MCDYSCRATPQGVVSLMSTTNKFSVLGAIDSDEHDKCFPSLAGTKSADEPRSSHSRVSRDRSLVSKAPEITKCRSPDSILEEADNIRKSLLGLTYLSKYETIDVRSVAKSIEDEVNILRKGKPFDSKRLVALEKRINYLKRSKSPIRINALWGDENGEDGEGTELEENDLESDEVKIADKEENSNDYVTAKTQRFSIASLSLPSKDGNKEAGKEENSGDDVDESSEEGEDGSGTDEDVVSEDSDVAEVVGLNQLPVRGVNKGEAIISSPLEAQEHAVDTWVEEEKVEHNEGDTESACDIPEAKGGISTIEEVEIDKEGDIEDSAVETQEKGSKSDERLSSVSSGDETESDESNSKVEGEDEEDDIDPEGPAVENI